MNQQPVWAAAPTWPAAIVRDLLLHVKNTDIDIVIEGDGIRFAKYLADKHRGIVHPHEKFGTATVIFPDQTRIDVATARLEYYEHPAAKPTVENSSIKLDLYRRDFTINAMAIHLNPGRFGALVDYFNCQNDLKERRIQFCTISALSRIPPASSVPSVLRAALTSPLPAIPRN